MKVIIMKLHAFVLTNGGVAVPSEIYYRPLCLE